MIFIEYENNRYCFIHHTQGNTIFHSTYTIFDEGLFPICTNSHTKECKLYDDLLDKTSSEIELLAPNSSGKYRPTPVHIPHIPIPPTYSPSPSLTYKSISPPSTLWPKKPIFKIEEMNDIDSDVEIQPPSPQ